MSVVEFPNRSSVSPTPDALWADYVKAAAKAQKSKDFNDGLKAGQAWQRFLGAFSHAV